MKIKLSDLHRIIKEAAAGTPEIQAGDWVKYINKPDWVQSNDVGQVQRIFKRNDGKMIATVSYGQVSTDNFLENLMLASSEEIKAAQEKQEADRSYMAKMINTSREGT